jgi:UDPglucose 6-dehydrogenase
LREAPSIPLITALQDMGAKVRVYDPMGMEAARQVLADVAHCAGRCECVEDADAAVIVTEWEEFRALDLERVRDLMVCPVIVDLRNIYRPDDMRKQGFAYACVGRAATYHPASIYVPSPHVPSLASAEVDRSGSDRVASKPT